MNQWHEEEFRLFAAHREYWEKLSEYNRGTYQSGLNYFMSKEIWKKKLSENDTMQYLNSECYDGANPWLRDAIPISFDRCDSDIILLHPEIAKDLSYAETEYLLGKNVITDGASLKILINKCVNFGIEATEISDSDILKIGEDLTAHPVNPKGFEHWNSSCFAEGRNEAYYFTPYGADYEVIGRYSLNNETVKTEDSNISGHAAELIFKTEKGAKWAVLGYAPWKGIMSLAKRDQILNIADYISENSLAVRMNTPFKSVILPRKNPTGKTVSVSITNCTVGKSGQTELLIRNPLSEKFVFMSQNSREVKVEYEKRGADYILKVPSLEAWSVGTVFCEQVDL